MKKTKHTRAAREYGFAAGQMQPGPMNLITDVSGVRVGHVTISTKDIQTGVTAVLPHAGNLFQEKLKAAYAKNVPIHKKNSETTENKTICLICLSGYMTCQR